VTAFFFGDSARPLFGFHHPPAGRAARPLGVVICNPFGQEYMRAHRALRELAARLARDGFHVLRFDYHGAGDSAGDSGDGSVAEWLSDIGLAITELRELGGGPRVALVGVRLGATLAALTARERPDVARLVLWDPVLDGAAYLEELDNTQRDWLEDHAPGAAREARREVLGFPLPEPLAASIAGLRLNAPEPAETTTLVIDHRSFPGARVWHHEDGVDRTLVPQRVIEAVAAWLQEPGA
jgi:pimeloyl-ACP methyl ester carboxylesterase